MKLLIASDLHGCAHSVRALMKQIDNETPDKIILLGDLLYHGPRNDLPLGYAPKEVIPLLNSIAEKITAVRGNCDAEVDQMVLNFPCQADFALIEADGRTLYATHGHLSENSPDNPPRLDPGSAFLSGHTHIKTLDLQNQILFVNPGSTTIPKDGCASFCIYHNEVFTLKTLYGETLKECSW